MKLYLQENSILTMNDNEFLIWNHGRHKDISQHFSSAEGNINCKFYIQQKYP